MASPLVTCKEDWYKVLVVGDIATGKTSIIQMYLGKNSRKKNANSRTTVGVDFGEKIVAVDGRKVLVQLWDIAGQERFSNMTRAYYREAMGALLVFDATRISTFESTVVWKSDIDRKVVLPDGSLIPVVLLANKCDLTSQVFQKQIRGKLNSHCDLHGFKAWFETSATKNIGITDAMSYLFRKITEDRRRMEMSHTLPEVVHATDSGSFKLEKPNPEQTERHSEDKRKCCN